MTDLLKLALPQLAPIWLSRDEGLAQVIETIETASAQNADLIVFSESFVPGYRRSVRRVESGQYGLLSWNH